MYHEQRNTAAAEVLVQALVWESKYRAAGIKAGVSNVRRSADGDDHVTSEVQSSSLYLRCSVTLQLSSVCLRRRATSREPRSAGTGQRVVI
jgi:hypothetical protein